MAETNSPTGSLTRDFEVINISSDDESDTNSLARAASFRRSPSSIASPFPDAYIVDLCISDDDYSIIGTAQDDDENERWNSDEEDDDSLSVVEQFVEELTQEEYDDSIARKEYSASGDSSSTALPGLTDKSGKKHPHNLVAIDKVHVNGTWELKPKMFVELLPGLDEFSDQSTGDFLLVDSIQEDLASEEIFLRGTKFRRTHRLKGMLERKLNEVYMLQKHDEHDYRSIHEQSLEDVPVHAVLCTRMLVLTNQGFPNLSWRTWNIFSLHDVESIRENAQLVCRFKHTIMYSNPNNRRTGRIETQWLTRLTESEADPDYATSDRALRQQARSPNQIVDLTNDEAVSSYREKMKQHGHNQGYSKIGHGSKINNDSKEIIDLDKDEAPRTVFEISDDETLATEEAHHSIFDRLSRRRSMTGATRRSIRRNAQEMFTAIPEFSGKMEQSDDDFEMLNEPPRARFGSFGQGPIVADPSGPIEYTFGDGFAGAGGMSKGASLAGMRIKWAFDKWADATRTYRHNFRNVRIFRKEAYEFVTRWRDTRMIDVLHLSPPCQAFSPAHTVQGKDDETNEASLFSVGFIIQKARPRIVTIEETSGIQTHHPIFLHALILQLTRLGYSVAWKVMNFAEFGLAQPRKRLIIIAACPGEPLPPFPKRTHGPGLKPFTTIRDALRLVRKRMPNQDLRRCVPRDRPSYSFDTQLRACITCSGGQGNLFPDGKRTFTERELACLQGFPVDHVFLGKTGSVKKQIGNAVPPVFAKQLYETIIKTLRDTDAAEAAGNVNGNGNGNGNSGPSRRSSAYTEAGPSRRSSTRPFGFDAGARPSQRSSVHASVFGTSAGLFRRSSARASLFGNRAGSSRRPSPRASFAARQAGRRSSAYTFGREFRDALSNSVRATGSLSPGSGSGTGSSLSTVGRSTPTRTQPPFPFTAAGTPSPEGIAGLEASGSSRRPSAFRVRDSPIAFEGVNAGDRLEDAIMLDD